MARALRLGVDAALAPGPRLPGRVRRMFGGLGADVVVDEVRISTSRCGPFAKAIAWMASGTLELDRLIAAEYALEDVNDALRAARGTGKVLRRPVGAGR